MPQKLIRFPATSVECGEAGDWEIVQVSFESERENITAPYLLLSVAFEMGNEIQVEFHDGEDFDGDSLKKIDLWRTRAIAVTERGHEIDVDFEISDEAFSELRKHLKVLLRSDCFRG